MVEAAALLRDAPILPALSKYVFIRSLVHGVNLNLLNLVFCYFYLCFEKLSVRYYKLNLGIFCQKDPLLLEFCRLVEHSFQHNVELGKVSLTLTDIR